MNSVTLIGNLTKDNELQKTNSGKVYLRFTLAVNKMGDGVDFINCIAWEKRAEVINEYTSKGSKIGIRGHISTGSYDDKTTGKKIYTTDIVADEIELLGAKHESKTEPKPQFDVGSKQVASPDDLPF